MAEGMQPCAGCGEICNTNLLSCPNCGLLHFWKVAADRATWRYSKCHVCGMVLPWATPPDVCPNPQCQQKAPLTIPYNVMRGGEKVRRHWFRSWPFYVSFGLALLVFTPVSLFSSYMADRTVHALKSPEDFLEEVKAERPYDRDANFYNGAAQRADAANLPGREVAGNWRQITNICWGGIGLTPFTWLVLAYGQGAGRRLRDLKDRLF